MYLWSRLGLSAFAFCIALMQFGMPVISYARMAQESRLGQIICSPSGATKRVFVEADGTFREADTSTGHVEHCTLCCVGGAGSPAMQAATPDITTGEGPIKHRGLWLPYDAATLAPPATGPPFPS
jgi:hypothetical protein